MALADILNADMTTVSAALRQGFAWWTDELAAMLPAWARRPGGGAVEADVSDPEPAFYRDGRRLASSPRSRRVAVRVPSGQALIREATLPRVPAAETRALIALELDRLTPLAADAATFDFVRTSTPAAAGRQTVLIAVARRAQMGALAERARRAGLIPAALTVDAPGTPRPLDPRPGLGGSAPLPWWADPRRWWALVAALLIAAVVIAIERDRARVDHLQALVDAQSDSVALAGRLNARVRTEDRARAELVARRAASDPLPLLGLLTHTLRPPTWVQQLDWDGQTLRLTGAASEAADPVRTLRETGAFASVRAAGTEGSTQAAGLVPFSLIAERNAPRPAPRAAIR